MLFRSLLALSRQPMPLLRREPATENKSARGAYVLLEADGAPRQLTLWPLVRSFTWP